MNPGLPGVGIAGISEVPLAGAGFGQGSDVRARSAVGQLRIEGIIPGGRAAERQRARGDVAMDDGPGVAPDQGIVVGDVALDQRARTRQGEEAVGGRGLGAENKRSIVDVSAIDEAGQPRGIEDQVSGGAGRSTDAAGDTTVGQGIDGDGTRASFDGGRTRVGVRTDPKRGARRAALEDAESARA